MPGPVPTFQLSHAPTPELTSDLSGPSHELEADRRSLSGSLLPEAVSGTWLELPVFRKPARHEDGDGPAAASPSPALEVSDFDGTNEAEGSGWNSCRGKEGG